MVQSHFNTSALFEGSMIPQMAYTDWSWNVFTFAFPRTSKFSSNRSYATLSPPLLLSPGYVRSSGINYFTFTEPKHYMVNFVNHFFSGIWPTKGNFQGTAARWRKHQPLHTHSSLQSVALGMVKRYKPGFSRSEIIQKLQIACFYMKKNMSKCSYRSKM